MHHQVFISYAGEDKDQADRVCAFLEDRGIRCWIAPRDIPPGDQYGEAIVEAIERSRLMVLMFSAAANASQFVTSEAELAMSHNRMIIPFRLEDAPISSKLALYIRTSQWLDAFRGPMDDNLERLADRVSDVTAGPPQQRTEPAETADGRAETQAPPRPKTRVDAPPSRLTPRAIAIGAVLLVLIAGALYWGLAGAGPKDAEYLINLGVAALESDKPEAAVRHLSRAIRLKPDEFRAHFFRGNAYFSQGLYDRAIADYTAAIALAPDLHEAVFNRAVCHLNKRMHDEAIADYNRAMELNPTDPASYEGRAKVWFNRRDYDRAWEDVNRALERGGRPDPELMEALRQASGRRQ